MSNKIKKQGNATFNSRKSGRGMSSLEVGALSRIIENLNSSALGTIQQLLDFRKAALGLTLVPQHEKASSKEDAESSGKEKAPSRIPKKKKEDVWERPIVRETIVGKLMPTLSSKDRNTTEGLKTIRLLSITLGAVARLWLNSDELIITTCDLLGPYPDVLKCVGEDFLAVLRRTTTPVKDFLEIFDKIPKEVAENLSGTPQLITALMKIRALANKELSSDRKPNCREVDDDGAEEEEESKSYATAASGEGSSTSVRTQQ